MRMSNEAQMLFNHTVLIGSTAAKCGKCGEGVIRRQVQCVRCRTQFFFSAVTYEVDPDTRETLRIRIEQEWQMLEFIGFTRGSWVCDDIELATPVETRGFVRVPC